MIRKIFKIYSNVFKQKRRKILFDKLHPVDNFKILDLGGNDGTFLSILFPDFKKDNLYVADISEEALLNAKQKYGYNTILLDESGKIPFDDKYFDIIFCNSVIEHVTVNKNECYKIDNWQEFNTKSFQRQQIFANEIIRCSKSYFVQTPYKYFPIESHTWFPFFYLFLNRKYYLKCLNLINKYWIKGSIPDCRLFTIKEMKQLFPNSEIIKERNMLFVKSLIAINQSKN
jgi:hypothetical protein